MAIYNAATILESIALNYTGGAIFLAGTVSSNWDRMCHSYLKYFSF
jgi:hypothetical protein